MGHGNTSLLKEVLMHRIQLCTTLKELQEVLLESYDFPGVSALALERVEEFLRLDLSLAESIGDCVEVRSDASDADSSIEACAQRKIDSILREKLEKATTIGGCYLDGSRYGSIWVEYAVEQKKQIILLAQIRNVSTVERFNQIQSDINSVGDSETRQKASDKLESLSCQLISEAKTVGGYLNVLSVLPNDSKQKEDVKRFVNILLREELNVVACIDECLEVYREAPDWSKVKGEAWQKHLEFFQDELDEVNTTEECFDLYVRIPRFYDVKSEALAKLSEFLLADLEVVITVGQCEEMLEYVEEFSVLWYRFTRKATILRREELWFELRRATTQEECWKVFVDDASNKKIKHKSLEKYHSLSA